MDLYCTRPGCSRPVNHFPDLDDTATLKTALQKYCTTCGMGLILVGRYLPTKLLGQGGFGAAFLARDRYTPGMRQCVVKQFQPSGTLTPAQLEIAQNLFEREAEVLEHLGNKHPQIPDLFAFFEQTVPSLQAGKQDKFFYLVQEFIDGQTLEEAINQQGAFTNDAVVALLEAILPVLTFVHENGSIHRDIKPSNIMRHRDGLYYLLDFGAVRQATKGGAVAKSTGIYSLGFAPPEQMAGSEVYPSSDLYALAVTCIMLLTAKPPNELFDSYRNVWNWRHDAAHTSDALADVLDRMLLPSASQRFQSAEAVLQALQSFPQAVSPPKSYPTRPIPNPAGVPQAQTSRSAPPRPPLPVAQTAPPIGSASPAPLSPRTPAPRPSPPSPAPIHAPSSPPPAIPAFSTLELLSGAAFTGFEGGLLAIALVSLLGTSLLSAGFWVFLLAGLVFLQSRRIIERMDLLIIAGITLVLVLSVPELRQILTVPGAGNGLVNVLFIAVLAGLLAIAITTLFRLIYKLLSNFF